MLTGSKMRKFRVFISLFGGFAACYIFRQRSQPPGVHSAHHIAPPSHSIHSSSSTTTSSSERESTGRGENEKIVNFQVVGDWGVPRAPWESSGSVEMNAAQRHVASSMNTWAASTHPQFILSVGDHAYPIGLRSENETARLDVIFAEVYNGTALRHVPWHLTLGNHDCCGDTAAQYNYGGRNPRWHIEPYYRISEPLGHGNYSGELALFVLDMCTFVCGREGPPNWRCEASDDMPAVSSQGPAKRTQMVEWLKKELDAAGCGTDPSAGGHRTWCGVVGHWPAFSFGGNGPTDVIIEELVPLMQKAGVQAYFSGHDHNLQAISHQGIHFFVSGAGGYNLHPELKPEVQTTAHALNKGATSLLKHVGHGFFSVAAHVDSMEVVAVNDKAQLIQAFQVPYSTMHSQPAPAYTVSIPAADIASKAANKTTHTLK